jgi:hypothetical protein
MKFYNVTENLKFYNVTENLKFYNETLNLGYYISEYYEYMPEYEILLDFIYSIGGIV